MAIDTCAYCSEKKELTDDHVPPKLWLEEPYPDNLVTVPACWDCNKKFQKDDEYTRTVIALDFRAARNSAAQSRLPKIFRSLQRPQARGFSEYLRSQLKKSDLVDSLGRPLGIRAEVDRSRIEATGERIAKGLHFHFGGQPLPRDAQVFVYSKPGYDAIDFIIPNFTAVLEKCGAQRIGQIGAGFSYVAGASGDAYVFGILLYEYFWWIVAVLPAHVKLPA